MEQINRTAYIIKQVLIPEWLLSSSEHWPISLVQSVALRCHQQFLRIEMCFEDGAKLINMWLLKYYQNHAYNNHLIRVALKVLQI